MSVLSTGTSGPRGRSSDDTVDDFARHVGGASGEISPCRGDREHP